MRRKAKRFPDDIVAEEEGKKITLIEVIGFDMLLEKVM